jgi:hypothetical protein
MWNLFIYFTYVVQKYFANQRAQHYQFENHLILLEIWIWMKLFFSLKFLQLSPTPMVQIDPKPDKSSSNSSTKFQEVQRKWMTTSPSPQHLLESDSDEPVENIYKKTQSKSVTSGANSVKNLTNR